MSDTTVTPIRPGMPTEPPAGPAAAMLTESHLDRALYELAQSKLFEADAVIETTALALRKHFEADWPAGVPEFQRVLSVASRLVKEAYESLEYVTVKKRAQEIAEREQAAVAS